MSNLSAELKTQLHLTTGRTRLSLWALSAIFFFWEGEEKIVCCARRFMCCVVVKYTFFPLCRFFYFRFHSPSIPALLELRLCRRRLWALRFCVVRACVTSCRLRERLLRAASAMHRATSHMTREKHKTSVSFVHAMLSERSRCIYASQQHRRREDNNEMKMKTRNLFMIAWMPSPRWMKRKTSLLSLTLSRDAQPLLCWLGQPSPTLTEGSEESHAVSLSLTAKKKSFSTRRFSVMLRDSSERKTKVRVDPSSSYVSCRELC